MTREVIKVTLNGYEKLLLKKQELFAQLKNVQSEKNSLVELCGNAWLDDFSYEELCRQEMIINHQIADVLLQIDRSELVGTPTNNKILQIGHVALFQFDDGEERKYEIVGFGESKIDACPPKLEYLAPIVRKFIGMEVDTVAEVKICNKDRVLILLEIFQKEEECCNLF